MTIRAHSKEFCALLAHKSCHINKVVQRRGSGREIEREGGRVPPPLLTCSPYLLTIMNNFKCQRRRRFTRNSIICGQCHQCNYTCHPHTLTRPAKLLHFLAAPITSPQQVCLLPKYKKDNEPYPFGILFAILPVFIFAYFIV